MNWFVNDIAKILGCTPSETNAEIRHIIIDSRTVNVGSHTLFVAINGDRNDGHDYIVYLYEKGVRVFLVDENTSIDLEEAIILRVPNTVEALQKIASKHRSNFSIPVIGLTGSNGKTIVKEWLYAALKSDYAITRSPKSFNSQVGVPLSVLQLNEQSELGIFEAGISQPNEMPHLEPIIQPTIGVFTNIGAAHDEGFESRAQKIKEKLLLFSGVKTLIYCSDHVEIHKELKDDPRTLSWGEKGDIMLKQDGGWKLNYQGRELQVDLPFTERAHCENAFHVIAVMLLLGLDHAQIQKKVKELRPVKMRLSLLAGNNDALIIDDSYSNDLPALELSLNFLQKHQQGRDAVVVLSDILESGIEEEKLYKEVARLINNISPKQVLLVGDVVVKYSSLFVSEVFIYSSTEELLRTYSFSNFGKRITLFKGARKFRFERLVKRLSNKVHDTTLEINLDQMVNNLNYFKSIIKPETKVMAMVKAYAYGSGYLEVANALQYQNIDYLAVAYVDEGLDLRNNGIHVPIMVLNAEPENFNKLKEYRIEPEVFRLDQIEQYDQLAEEPFDIHLKIDTGMHRLGFGIEQVGDLIEKLKQVKQLKVKSVFTHLSSADEPADDEFTRSQLGEFEKIAQEIECALGHSVMKHVLNSAGIQRFPEYQYDMVRLGIGLYGIGIAPEHQHHLEEMGVLKSRISQVRTIAKGESIGYNRRTIAENEMQIATVAIGYADGYDRRFSNGVGRVFVGGEVRKVVGNVCMDMIMIDATGLSVEVGDEVEILGGHISWDEAAKNIGTISYELLTGIGDRVKRLFYEGDLI